MWTLHLRFQQVGWISKHKSTAKIWNSMEFKHEIWGLHKYCKLTTSYYDFLKFTSHTYLIKTRYTAISIDNTKCTFCTKFVFSCFSICLQQTLCIMHELEMLMWQAHPWQDFSVNVNFGATSNEQSTRDSLNYPRSSRVITSGLKTEVLSWEWAWQ